MTAHTADDQAETVLHRIVRGTGLTGLAGIRRARPLGPGVTLLRPLLACRRADILDYLEAIGQPFRTDSSNRDPQFTRNRLRHELLPLLAAGYNPRVVDALLRLGTMAADVAEVLDGLVDGFLEQNAAFAPQAVQVFTQRLPSSRHLVRELLVHIWRRQGWPQQAMTHTHWNSLAEILEASARPGHGPRTRKHFPGAVLVESRLGEVLFTRKL